MRSRLWSFLASSYGACDADLSDRRNGAHTSRTLAYRTEWGDRKRRRLKVEWARVRKLMLPASWNTHLIKGISAPHSSRS